MKFIKLGINGASDASTVSTEEILKQIEFAIFGMTKIINASVGDDGNADIYSIIKASFSNEQISALTELRDLYKSWLTSNPGGIVAVTRAASISDDEQTLVMIKRFGGKAAVRLQELTKIMIP